MGISSMNARIFVTSANLAQVRAVIEGWRRDYKETRLRSALNNPPPSEYAGTCGTGNDIRGLNAAQTILFLDERIIGGKEAGLIPWGEISDL